jgi:hypothetical protein
METEANNNIPFLDVHVIRKQSSIITAVYRKPTHTGRYLNFHSNHPPHVKRGIIWSLYNRATIICREQQDLAHEVNNWLRNDVKPIGSVIIPYVKGISDKFKWIGNRYNIRTIFKTMYTLRSTLMRTRPMSDP